jgi:hypothetical protein
MVLVNRRLKTFVPALLAAVALSALTGPAAHAQFTSSQGHTFLTGKLPNSHSFAAGGFHLITCEIVGFTGTTGSTSETTLTLTPSYSGCKDQAGRTVDVDTNNLAYTFTSGANKGTVHISGQLTFTATNGGSVVCTTVIKAQTNWGLEYHNLGGTSGYQITFLTSDLVTTTSGGTFNCGVANGDHSTGVYSGEITMTGAGTDGSAATISVD